MSWILGPRLLPFKTYPSFPIILSVLLSGGYKCKQSQEAHIRWSHRDHLVLCIWTSKSKHDHYHTNTYLSFFPWNSHTFTARVLFKHSYSFNMYFTFLSRPNLPFFCVGYSDIVRTFVSKSLVVMTRSWSVLVNYSLPALNGIL